MNTRIFINCIGLICLISVLAGCKLNTPITKKLNTGTPDAYQGDLDTNNLANLIWKDYFTDQDLTHLIDSALENNQNLNMTLQEIQVYQNEIRSRKGAYLPFVGLGASGGVEKTARYTSQGASDATTDIKPGVATPDPLPNYMVGAYATWEVDIWHKLRNAKKSAVFRYLSSVEGKNFMVTNLIGEIATAYYELLALDNQLRIVHENIKIQSDALAIVRREMKAARVTELAVRRFEAQVLKTRSMAFYIQQQIVVAENRINFLVGRFPQHVIRTTDNLVTIDFMPIKSGIPSQLLANRPDVKQAELDLEAAKLDVKVAKANFYPTLNITASLGMEAFNPAFLFSTPESILYGLAGGLAGPLVNRNAIKATYFSANSKQLQAIFAYEKTILNAYIEVVNQLAKIQNLEKSYDLITQQVETLNRSIEISSVLFKSARADYMEVLLTQNAALDSKFEMIETKKRQLTAKINIYRALGGGWR